MGRPGFSSIPVTAPRARRLWNVRDALALLLLLALVATVFSRFLFTSADIVPGMLNGDAQTQWAPWREFAFSGLLRGEFPMWNPYVMCGTPFFAGWQSAMLYPPNFLFAVLPLHAAARLLLIGHLWLAAAAAYLLARRLRVSRMGSLIAGAAFSLGAPELLRVFAGHWGAVCALAWMPLILLAIEAIIRRRSIGAALLGGLWVALQLLAGAPQQTAYTWILAAVYLVLRIAMPPRDLEIGNRVSFAARALILGAVMFTFGAILAGAQLVPALAALPLLQRSGPVTPEWAAAFSLSPLHLVNFVAPNLFGNDATARYWGLNYVWEMCGYVGIVTLMLAAAGVAARARRGIKWVLTICAAVMMLLALGSYVPPLFALYRALPMMSMLRGTCKFLAPLALALSLLAGLGFDALMEADRRRLLRAVVACGVVAGLMLVAGLYLYVGDAGWQTLFDGVQGLVRANRPLPAFDARAGAIARHAASADLARSGLLLAVCAAALLLRWRRLVPAIATGAALVVLSCADLTSFAWSFTRPVSGGFDPYVLHVDADTLQFLQDHAADGRVVISTGTVTNESVLLGLRTPEGVDPNAPQTWHEIFAWATGAPESIVTSRFAITRPSRLWDLVGARYFCIPAKSVPSGMDMRLVKSGAELDIYENPRAMQRAFIVHRTRVSHAGPAALNEMDFRSEVLLAEDAAVPMWTGAPLAAGTVTEQARLIVDKPDRIVVEATLTSAGWLVLTDNFFPGWRAQANGVSAPILQADYSFRAVPLGPGRNTIVFTYTPSGLTAGVLQSALAALAGLGWLGVWIGCRIRRKTKDEGRTTAGS